jgi:hypothetical protein
MLVLVILSGAKDLKFYSEHAQGNKSEMFRFAQHEQTTIDCSMAAGRLGRLVRFRP